MLTIINEDKVSVPELYAMKKYSGGGEMKLSIK
jgi:hypothetical protein